MKYIKIILLIICLLPVVIINSINNQKTNIFKIESPDYKVSPYTGMTRNHWKDAALYVLKGAFSYVHTLNDPMKFPKQEGKSYPNFPSQLPTERLEGLCRTLFVAAPLLREDSTLSINGIKVIDYYRFQIGNLVNSKSECFIRKRSLKGGASQNLVEFGALCISLSAIPDLLWTPLSPSVKDSLASTMLSYGDGPTVDSNWKFFNIFVMSFLKSQGYTVNDVLMKQYLDKSLSHYRGEGWYNDNPAYDYYSMWAFQMYGIYWAHYYGKAFPEIASAFIRNFREMSDNYPYMFSKDGQMIMWGRSISYRYGSVAPFTLSGLEPDTNTNYGWLRRISSSTLLQFLKHPDFMKDSVPVLGFYGPFEPAVQQYSCRGSVYWSGKAFLGLLLPPDNPFWSAIENNGPWEKSMKEDSVYNKFEEGSKILISDYPQSGASEIRSWCNVPVIGMREAYRGGESYNRLSYNSLFPWQADGANGEVAMNYIVKNNIGQWEPLRMYTFINYENEVYKRKAVLETNKNIRFSLNDITLSNGILRVDCINAPDSTQVRFGGYALPEISAPIKLVERIIKGHKVLILDNGTYQLATVSVEGWNKDTVINCTRLHPEANNSKVVNLIYNKQNKDIGFTTLITLHLWKKSGSKWTEKELFPIKNIKKGIGEKAFIIQLLDGRSIVFENQ